MNRLWTSIPFKIEKKISNCQESKQWRRENTLHNKRRSKIVSHLKYLPTVNIVRSLPSNSLGCFVCFDVASGSSNWITFVLKIKYDFLYEKEHVCCLEEWSSPVHQKIYTTFILVILFLLPLMVMLILYSKIGYELWIKKRVGDGSVLRTIHGKEMSKIARCVAWNIHLFKTFTCFRDSSQRFQMPGQCNQSVIGNLCWAHALTLNFWFYIWQKETARPPAPKSEGKVTVTDSCLKCF